MQFVDRAEMMFQTFDWSILIPAAVGGVWAAGAILAFCYGWNRVSLSLLGTVLVFVSSVAYTVLLPMFMDLGQVLREQPVDTSTNDGVTWLWRYGVIAVAGFILATSFGWKYPAEWWKATGCPLLSALGIILVSWSGASLSYQMLSSEVPMRIQSVPDTSKIEWKSGTTTIKFPVPPDGFDWGIMLPGQPATAHHVHRRVVDIATLPGFKNVQGVEVYLLYLKGDETSPPASLNPK